MLWWGLAWICVRSPAEAPPTESGGGVDPQIKLEDYSPEKGMAVGILVPCNLGESSSSFLILGRTMQVPTLDTLTVMSVYLHWALCLARDIRTVSFDDHKALLCSKTLTLLCVGSWNAT